MFKKDLTTIGSDAARSEEPTERQADLQIGTSPEASPNFEVLPLGSPKGRKADDLYTQI